MVGRGMPPELKRVEAGWHSAQCGQGYVHSRHGDWGRQGRGSQRVPEDGRVGMNHKTEAA
jgi:hypothetical protein